MTFTERFPSLRALDEDSEFSSSVKDAIMMYCRDVQRIKEAINKIFVCGYYGPGVHDSKVCRKCLFEKELRL